MAGPEDFKARLFVDAETHLPLMLTYMEPEARVMMRTVTRDGRSGGPGAPAAGNTTQGGTPASGGAATPGCSPGGRDDARRAPRFTRHGDAHARGARGAREADEGGRGRAAEARGVPAVLLRLPQGGWRDASLTASRAVLAPRPSRNGTSRATRSTRRSRRIDSRSAADAASRRRTRTTTHPRKATMPHKFAASPAALARRVSFSIGLVLVGTRCDASAGAERSQRNAAGDGRRSIRRDHRQRPRDRAADRSSRSAGRDHDR